MTERDEWELSSGLALDGADVTVTAVEFGFNANIGGGTVLCANFIFTDDATGDDYDQSFSVGNGWDASRDGSELVSDKPKSINKNTNFGVLITSAVELLDGDGSKLGGSPKQASTWIGSRWKMGTIKREVVNPTTQAKTEKDAFVFVEYHGKGDAPASSTASTSGSKASASTAAADIPEELWTELVELARGSDDHDAFVNAALDLPAVDSNKAAQKAIMGTRAGSVWAAR